MLLLLCVAFDLLHSAYFDPLIFRFVRLVFDCTWARTVKVLIVHILRMLSPLCCLSCAVSPQTVKMVKKQDALKSASSKSKSARSPSSTSPDGENFQSNQSMSNLTTTRGQSSQTTAYKHTSTDRAVNPAPALSRIYRQKPNRSSSLLCRRSPSTIRKEQKGSSGPGSK